jgi:hypothetical protein
VVHGRQEGLASRLPTPEKQPHTEADPEAKVPLVTEEDEAKTEF